MHVGRQRVATMMKRMGVEALYRRPNTSKPSPGHKIYPYLLRELKVERANQVWAMAITYIPIARGDIQHRPGQSVRQRSLHRRADQNRDRHQDGKGS